MYIRYMGRHAYILYIISLLLSSYNFIYFFYVREYIFLLKYPLLTTHPLKLFSVDVLRCSKYVLITYYKVTTCCSLIFWLTTIKLLSFRVIYDL